MADIAAGTPVAQERRSYEKCFGAVDLVLFTACAVVGLDSAAL